MWNRTIVNTFIMAGLALTALTVESSNAEAQTSGPTTARHYWKNGPIPIQGSDTLIMKETQINIRAYEGVVTAKLFVTNRANVSREVYCYLEIQGWASDASMVRLPAASSAAPATATLSFQAAKDTVNDSNSLSVFPQIICRVIDNVTPRVDAEWVKMTLQLGNAFADWVTVTPGT